MEFLRLLEFCNTIDRSTAQDDIRLHLPRGLEQAPTTFEPYEQSLNRLDQPTWEYIKQRLLQRTIKHPTRGWAQFYDTLAEVRGYCHLLDRGYANVRFIPENNNFRTPDIEANDSSGTSYFLESKSIGFSDDERNYILENTRRLGTGQTLIARNVTQGMPQGLKDKIISTITYAKGQLLNYEQQNTFAGRIIYLTLHLDIHMFLDMRNYTEVANFARNLIRTENDVEIVVDKLSSI
ncbi:hypothetical protein B6D29_04630 [Microgenomates bacterium UTCPR1]|nr:MAG: hypothetical protein B6D29_04630 [Microgenomates bacterium UTCPR1]